MAPGVLFCTTTVESCDFVMMRENPEKSEKIVSKYILIYDKVFSMSVTFVSFLRHLQIRKHF